MNDDWRLQIDLHEEGRSRTVTDRLDSRQLQHDLSEAFHDRVIVTRDGARVFLYAGTREQAEKARHVIEAEARQRKWTVDIDLRHWHQVAEDWEGPDVPEPTSEAEKEAEREGLMKTEDEETAARGGLAEFEVRAEFPSHREAKMLAEKLKDEGLQPVRRWRYLVVGAADEDAVKELAERIRAEAPADGKVTTEGSLAVAWAERPPNPFVVLGGLGG
jgi:hypothetical protein